MKRVLCLVMVLLLLLLASCSTASSTTDMKFSYSTSNPADSSDTKSLYFNEDMALVELQADLKIDSGSAIVTIANPDGRETKSELYTKDAQFSISLTDIKADTECQLTFETVQTKNATLTITSDVKMVKNPEKPDRFEMQKPAK